MIRLLLTIWIAISGALVVTADEPKDNKLKLKLEWRDGQIVLEPVAGIGEKLAIDDEESVVVAVHEALREFRDRRENALRGLGKKARGEVQTLQARLKAIRTREEMRKLAEDLVGDLGMECEAAAEAPVSVAAPFDGPRVPLPPAVGRVSQVLEVGRLQQGIGLESFADRLEEISERIASVDRNTPRDNPLHRYAPPAMLGIVALAYIVLHGRTEHMQRAWNTPPSNPIA